MEFLQGIFRDMDLNGDGKLTWQEFLDAFNNEDILLRWLTLHVEPSDLRDLFMILDSGDGTIGTTDFFDGLRRLKGPALAKDLFAVRKNLAKIEEEIELREATRASRRNSIDIDVA